ncbi:lamina-associated polypeptide 2, isoforms beta/gamma-like [Elgaria multicarinata webbii]|uniref:lamina-associated polypeptide 2, isoforms beta/gamma-like n=1 Tax=Elgaria multicarinata webbii TaxID=159646 RepID=UPI002FCCD7BF
MPEFLADPSVLNKERLKSELIGNNVSLPGGEQRKDVYVQLYLQHLTARNTPGAPLQLDFSSDEEREPTPVAARNRGGGGAMVTVGRKATKKTDKPRPEEQDDIDVTELSNEELKDQLLRYGVNPGPIVATTTAQRASAIGRKLYEKKLLKLKEPGQELSSFIPTPTVSSSTRNSKQNGNDESDQYSDNEEDPKAEFKLEKREPLKGKTKAPLILKQRRIAEHNQNYSHDGVTETFWRSGSSKSGLLQAVSRESARVSRRTPRKRVETTVPLPVHDAVISQSTPIADTAVASSNNTLQVVNRVPGNVKHADPILSVGDFSELPRRTSKKPLMTAEVIAKTSAEERRVERDILKEMFPYEASTPTGISASCHRPIKGAAGRPKELSDFRLEETYSSKYIPKYISSADIKPEKPTIKIRSIPLWIKILLFIVVAVFLFLVYQSMETNQGNPFSQFQFRNISSNAEEETV